METEQTCQGCIASQYAETTLHLEHMHVMMQLMLVCQRQTFSPGSIKSSVVPASMQSVYGSVHNVLASGVFA